MSRQETSDFGNALVYVGLDFSFGEAQHMPTAASEIVILLTIFGLLPLVAVPIVTVTFYGKFDRGERNVNPERHNRELTFGRIAFVFEGSKHSDFDGANTRAGLLSKVRIATSRTRSESAYQRGLNLADLAAHFARHLYFWLVQRVILAHLRQGGLPIRTQPRAARGFMIGRNAEMLAALWAHLCDARQTSMGILVGTIGACTGTVFAKAIVGKFFAALGACDNMGHVNSLLSDFDQATERLQALRWQLFSCLHYTTGDV